MTEDGTIMGFTDETTLEEAVMLSLGAASVCWERPEAAGVFESDRAKQIGDELLDLIRTRASEDWG